MARLYRRADVVFALDASSGTYEPVSGGYVTLYDVGGVVDTTQGSVTTSVTILPGHGFATTDYFLYCASPTSITTSTVYDISGVSDAATATTLTIAAVSSRSFAAGAYLLNLGADAAGAYTGSTMSTYQGPDSGFTANTNATVTTSSTGSYEYFWNGNPGWELIRNSGGTPLAINFIPRAMQMDLPNGTTMVLSTNTGVPRANFHLLENAANLHTLTATGLPVGFELTLMAASGTATVTDGSGNIQLGAATRSLTNNNNLKVLYNGTAWIETAFNTVA